MYNFSAYYYDPWFSFDDIEYSRCFSTYSKDYEGKLIKYTKILMENFGLILTPQITKQEKLFRDIIIGQERCMLNLLFKTAQYPETKFYVLTINKNIEFTKKLLTSLDDCNIIKQVILIDDENKWFDKKIKTHLSKTKLNAAIILNLKKMLKQGGNLHPEFLMNVQRLKGSIK